MTDIEPDLAAIRADQQACTAMGPFRGEPDAIDRLVDTHVPALLALAERQDEHVRRLEAVIVRGVASGALGEATERAKRAEAELAEARAEIERLRSGGEDPEPDPDCTTATPTGEYFRVQVYELFGEWSSVGRYWSAEADAVASMRRRRQAQADWPAMRVLRVRSWTERTVVVWEHPEDVTGTRNASRAPESPEGAPDPSNDPPTG
ncbi:hypothetical protein [Embleya sp. NPDC001921]